MNDFFDIKRFSLLAKRDIAENRKKYLLQFLSIFGILAIVLTYNSYTYYDSMTKYAYEIDDWLSVNQGIFIIGQVLFLAFGCMSASALMDPINTKAKKISYLMNPASSFEKYFLRWVMAVVVFIALYIVAFLMADFVQWLICTIRYPESEVRSVDYSQLIKTEYPTSRVIYQEWYLVFLAFSFYLYMQSLFILGSTFWQKNTFIKTFSAGLVIFLLYLLVCGGLISTIFPEGMNDFGLSIDSRMGDTSDEDRGVSTFKGITAGLFFFAFLNWVISYFRFREAEVAKRI